MPKKVTAEDLKSNQVSFRINNNELAWLKKQAKLKSKAINGVAKDIFKDAMHSSELLQTIQSLKTQVASLESIVKKQNEWMDKLIASGLANRDTYTNLEKILGDIKKLNDSTQIHKHITKEGILKVVSMFADASIGIDSEAAEKFKKWIWDEEFISYD